MSDKMQDGSCGDPKCSCSKPAPPTSPAASPAAGSAGTGPYRVIPHERPPCRTWSVTGPDGHIEDSETSVEKDARFNCERLNAAFHAGAKERENEIMDRAEKHGDYYWIHQSNLEAK